MVLIKEKRCSKCKIKKAFIEFSNDKSKRDGKASSCKECYNQYTKSHKEQRKKSDRLYRENHKDGVEYKERRRQYGKQYHEKHKEKNNQRNRQYHEKHKDDVEYKERRRLNSKQYHEKYKEKRNVHLKQRRKNDSLYKLRNNISNCFTYHLKNQGIPKKGSSYDYLPNTPQEYYKYLIMLWYKDFKKSSVDHIIPQSFYDFKDLSEIHKCYSLKNLRPMELEDNSSKSDDLDFDLIEYYNLWDVLPKWLQKDNMESIQLLLNSGWSINEIANTLDRPRQAIEAISKLDLTKVP